jgi:hypothetical protein
MKLLYDFIQEQKQNKLNEKKSPKQIRTLKFKPGKKKPDKPDKDKGK